MKKTLSAWLEEKFLKWRNEQNSRKANLTSFAKWLGIPRPSLSQYLSGFAVPQGENLFRIATKLGFEVYEILNYPQPDRAVKEWQALYEITPPDLREELLKISKEWLKKKGLE